MVVARGQLEGRHHEPGGVGVEVQVEEVDIHLADVRGAERVRGTDKTGYGGRGRRDLRTAVLGHSPQAGQHAGPHPDSRHRTHTTGPTNTHKNLVPSEDLPSARNVCGVTGTTTGDHSVLIAPNCHPRQSTVCRLQRADSTTRAQDIVYFTSTNCTNLFQCNT